MGDCDIETGVIIRCPTCDGDGEFNEGPRPTMLCPTCRGKGVLEEERRLITEDDLDEREDDWRPIATAPKDGTVIDLFGTRNGRPQRFPNGHWSISTRSGSFPLLRWHHFGWDVYGSFSYTHWMPVPPPPHV